MGKRFLKILRFVLLFAISIAIGWGVLYTVRNRPKNGYEAPVPPVRVAMPQIGRVAQSLKFNAYVEAQSMIPVVPFVAGTILEYYPEQGLSVNKDQVLAEIDPTPYKLQFDQARAAYLAADASYERVKSLVAVKAATQQSLDEITAQRDAYKAQMELAEVQIGYASVKAPVSGTILTVDSAKGSIAAQGVLLCSIADLSDLVVRVAIPEKYYTLIQGSIGTMHTQIMHGEDKADASFESLSPYINPQSKTFVLELALDGDISAFRPGMFVTVNIDYKTMEDVPVMSLEARNTDGTMYIFDPDSQTAKVVVFTPEAQDSERLIVPEEYAKALFIIDGQGTVFDGQRVRVME